MNSKFLNRVTKYCVFHNEMRRVCVLKTAHRKKCYMLVEYCTNILSYFTLKCIAINNLKKTKMFRK